MYATIGGGGGSAQDGGYDWGYGGGGGGFDSRGSAVPYIGMHYPDAAGQYAREMEQANRLDNFYDSSPVPEFVNPYTSTASDQAAQDNTWANVDPYAYVAPEDPYAHIHGYVDRTQVESGIATLPDHIQRSDVESGAVNTPYVDRTEVESGAVTTPFVDRTEVESGAVTTPYVTRDEVEQGNLDTISRVEPPPESVFVNPVTDNFLTPSDYAVNTGGGTTDPNAAMAANIQAGVDAQKRANDALAAAAAGQPVKSYVYSGDPSAMYTLFGQQATDPITGTEGKRYAFGGMTDSTPQFNNPFGPQPQSQSQPQPQGGVYNQQSSNVFGGFAPQPTQFQNPFGPQQSTNGQRMYSPGPMQPQNLYVGGNPQQSGLPSLLSTNTQNQYPNGYTPIGSNQQNFISSY